MASSVFPSSRTALLEDPNQQIAMQAKKAGCLFALDTDAHADTTLEWAAKAWQR